MANSVNPVNPGQSSGDVPNDASEQAREQTAQPPTPSASASGESFAAAVQRMWERLGALDEDALDPSGERDPEAGME